MREVLDGVRVDGDQVILGYLGLLLVLGVVIGFRVLQHLHRRRSITSFCLRPWQISWVDFAIIGWLISCWLVLASQIGNKLFPLAENASDELTTWRVVVVGFVGQLGFAGLFLLYHRLIPFERRMAFSPKPRSWGSAIKTGVICTLAALPVVMLSGAAWNFVVRYLQSVGLPIEWESQEAVGYLQDADPATFILLTILAVVVAPMAEELVFRAGVYRFLKGRYRARVAMVLSSALFALAHVNIASFVPLLILGILLSLTYEITGSIRVPIVFHACFNLNTVFIISLSGAFPN